MKTKQLGFDPSSLDTTGPLGDMLPIGYNRTDLVTSTFKEISSEKQLLREKHGIADKTGLEPLKHGLSAKYRGIHGKVTLKMK